MNQIVGKGTHSQSIIQSEYVQINLQTSIPLPLAHGRILCYEVDLVVSVWVVTALQTTQGGLVQHHNWALMKPPMNFFHERPLIVLFPPSRNNLNELNFWRIGTTREIPWHNTSIATHQRHQFVWWPPSSWPQLPCSPDWQTRTVDVFLKSSFLANIQKCQETKGTIAKNHQHSFRLLPLLLPLVCVLNICLKHGQPLFHFFPKQPDIYSSV